MKVDLWNKAQLTDRVPLLGCIARGAADRVRIGQRVSALRQLSRAA